MPRAAKAISEVKVSCPLYQVAIGKQQCQEQCSIIRKNKETCSTRGCPSPYRFCIHCLQQGYNRHDAVVTDAIKGACSYHLEFGIRANRNNPSSTSSTLDDGPVHEVGIEGQVLVIPTDRIRIFRDQPRKYFDVEELKALEQSIFRRSQLQPGIVRRITGDHKHDYELIDGQRRWHACSTLKFPFRATVAEPKDLEDQFEMSIAANFQRADHATMEVARAVERLCRRGGRSEFDVAVLFGKSQTWVNSHRRLVALVPELQEMLGRPARRDEHTGSRIGGGELPLGIAIHLAMLPADEQLTTYQELRKSDMSVVEARSHIRSKLPTDKNVYSHSNSRQLKPSVQYHILHQYVKGVGRRGSELAEQLKPDVVQKMSGCRNIVTVREEVLASIETLVSIYVRIGGTASGLKSATAKGVS